MKRSSHNKAAPMVPTISPGWIVKTSPKGKKYRVCTIPLDLLPLLLDQEGFVPRAYFHFPPENGEVLGVRKKDEKEEREL